MRQRHNHRIGVLGGGQLGRMMIPPALRLNVPLAFLDPDPDAPCRTSSPFFEVGDLNDENTVYDFGCRHDIVTIEIEHVNTNALRRLSEDGVVVRPSADIVSLVQDKLTQKIFYRERNLPTADFVALNNAAEVQNQRDTFSFPCIHKLRRGGYDGRGVQKLESADDPAAANFDAPSFLEQLIPFEKEIAVQVSRNAAGKIAVYPPVEMEFHPEANLVELLFAPAGISAGCAKRATELARDLAEALQLEGILAVEMFVVGDAEDVLINEIAPRPHNSGHHTIEACAVSQFEQHLRAILNLPPGDTGLLVPAAAMANLLGAAELKPAEERAGRGLSGPAIYDGLEKILATRSAFVHLYGKPQTRPMRKMGHITTTAADADAARELARNCRAALRITSAPKS